MALHFFTLGYEGTTVPDFLAALKAAGVRQLVDIRALPLSRRPGFSKSALRAALEEAGIAYTHLRALGTPAEGREAARKGRQHDLERVYRAQLELPEAIAATAQLRQLATEAPTALLCFEREPAGCHRSLWLRWEAPDAAVTDLFA